LRQIEKGIPKGKGNSLTLTVNNTDAVKTAIFSFALAITTLLGFAASANAANSALVVEATSYESLTAVLVVGTNSLGTSSALTYTEEITEFLEGKGVVVHRFYDDKSDWDAIKKAANGAHFFLYNGHGGRMGGGGKVGGLFLTTSVSSKEIVNELKLHKNAVVIFTSVCERSATHWLAFLINQELSVPNYYFGFS
jgi:hypothetical protein